MTLTVGSLFSGIGGLDLGLERAGMNVIWQSEIDPYACRVLSKHWPEVVNHGNIKEINWREVQKPDVICGGYPCQPFSTAGKRRGEEDPRHLWPWVRTAISELRPRYAILENVRGHLSMGGLSVIGELASIGYDAEWRIVSAASVGANHRRDRIIIVAYPNGGRCEQCQSKTESFQGLSCSCQRNMAYTDSAPRQQQQERQVQKPNFGGRSARHGNLADTNSIGLEGQRAQQQTTGVIRSSEIPNPISERWGGHGPLEQNRKFVFGWATDLRGENGYAGWQWWTTEPNVGRVAYGIPNRVDRLRGLGNAVVPQVAEVIGRLVISHAQHN